GGLNRPERIIRKAGDAAVDAAATRTTWSKGESRVFLSGRIDVGMFFLKPRISFGYGKPHFRWIGVDFNPVVSQSGIDLYTGLRFALPSVDLRIGGRYHYSFRRAYLERSGRYTRDDIDIVDFENANYFNFEAELSYGLSLGPGALFGETAVTYTTGVPDGLNLYEETMRVVIEPPWVGRQRLGYAFAFGFNGALSLGPVVEFLYLPGREDFVFRAGLVARLKLFDDLDARASFIPALATPDNLGLRGGDSFLIGARWRWATGLPE
ncbi:MAG: hypothetical protein ACI9MR_002597, partial [Myxococcota bacterium]